MTYKHWSTLLFLSVTSAACGDDATTPSDTEGSSSGTGEPSTMSAATLTTMTTSPPPDSTGMMDDSTTMVADATSSDGGDSESTAAGSSSDDGSVVLEPAEFFVRIENISDQGVLPTAISPGVWVNHEPTVFGGFFTPMMAAPDNGVELLAENGDPATLATEVSTRTGVYDSGVFDTPVGGAAAAPILPGESYEFTFTAPACVDEGSIVCSRLALAMMLGESNDVLLATGPVGLGLFVVNGQPQGEHEVTSSIQAWDIGTEANQAPHQGPNQAPYSGVDVGPPESGVVDAFASSTRAIPIADALVGVEVDQGDGVKIPANEYTITLTNNSGAFGTFVTPFSSLAWATHDDTVTLFDDGGAASAELEGLAEDGDADALVAALGGTAGIDQTAAVAGPFAPGESITFTVTPADTGRFLSFATMLGETNDAFLAMAPAGVALLEEDGSPRDDEDIEADIVATLGAWDAGTEANQTLGVGLDQAPRQAAPGQGLADGDPTVRRYFDIESDLAGDNAGGFLTVEVADGAGGGLEFDITITNTSDTTAYPGDLSPIVWAVHDDTATLFDTGAAASAGLEELAEDGDGAAFLAELNANANVGTAAIEGVAPLAPGDSITFTVTPDATNRFLGIAAMVQPSNDTFVALQPAGVALLDAAGAQRTPAEINADIVAALAAWDAGTENNQAGAAGGDMGPAGGANSGASEGSGIVRDAEDDLVWPVPPPPNMVRVTVGPTGN